MNHQITSLDKYDVVGAALQVFNQTEAYFQIGSFYEEVGAMQQQKQDQHPDLDSCVDCGKFIKKGTVVCARCLGC